MVCLFYPLESYLSSADLQHILPQILGVTTGLPHTALKLVHAAPLKF